MKTRPEITAVKASLKEIAPGMRFGVTLKNPRNRHASNYQTVEVEYNDVIAKERGLTKLQLRTVILHGLATVHGTEVHRVSLCPVVPYTPPINEEKLTAFIADLKEMANTPDEIRLAHRILALVSNNVTRQDRAFLDAVTKSI